MRIKILFSYLFISCLLLVHNGMAQDETTDSLKSVLEVVEEDSDQVNTLLALSDDARGYDTNEAIRYGMAAQSLANKIGYNHGTSLAFKYIGIGHYIQGNYMVAIEYWQLSLQSFQEGGELEGVANIQSNIGAAYSVMGDEARAIDFYFKSLKTSEEIGNANRIATALLNIGSIYSFKETTLNKALEYYWRALPYSLESGDQYTIGTAFSNLGETHFQLEAFDSALYYFEKALEPNENSSGLSYALNFMGLVYAQKEEYEKAEELQTEAIENAKQFNARLELSIALQGLATTYFKQGKTQLAIKNYEQAEEIARGIGSMEQRRESYEGLSKSYAQALDFQNAYKNELKYNNVKDSLYNEATDEAIKGLQFSYQLDKKETEIELKESEIEKADILRNFLFAAGIFLIIIMAGVTYQYWFTRKSNKIISRERNRSEKLLLNILPEETANELKEHGKAKARKYESVSILFTDFKGFTSLAATMSPEELVEEIDYCYRHFDDIVTKYGIEKIKTIGDAYMAAGGLPRVNSTHPNDVILAALEIRKFMLGLKERHERENKPFFEIRIGVHSGPVVSGIVGTKKFAYDIWGDTVNIAARMESNSEPGKINISQSTYELTGDNFNFEYRGEIEAKNRGMLKMYFVEPLTSNVGQKAQPV